MESHRKVQTISGRGEKREKKNSDDNTIFSTLF